MHLRQPLKALVLAMALVMASGVEVNKHEEKMSTCPVIQCCAPGTNGLPGRDGRDGREGPKGEKGDQAFVALQRQVSALEKNIQTLQADISKFQNIFNLRWAKIVGKKTFVSTGTKASFQHGKSLCAKAGGSLPCPRNEAENAALQEVVKKESNRAYLGLTDMQTEGKFVYLNGEPVAYTNWNRGEPNNQNNEDCVLIYDDGKWNDLDCSTAEILIICEF